MSDAAAEPETSAGSSEAHSLSDTAPTETQEPAPPPAKKPKVAKPPEPPWKTFEAAELPRGGRERKAPATFVAGPASGKRVDLNDSAGAQTRGDKAPQEEKANGSSQYDKAAVGKRVEVYWDGNDKWFKGEVKDYAPTTQKHLVKYEDNDTQWLILAQEEQLGQLRWLDGKPPRGGGKAKEEEKKPRAKKSNAYSMGPSWKCEKCGFVNMDMMNHGRRTICFMCETPRPGVSKEDLEKSLKPKYKALSSYGD